MRCSKCGSEGLPGKKFCTECGSQLSNHCSKCGSDNPPDAKFCADCGNALGPHLGSEIAKPSTEAISGIRIAAERITSDTTEGERKTVTALFADIKGSTELMADLDPEEARAIIDPALRLMIDAVHRYDGFIVQSTGDGIFALFGAPVAHEDHPQRALYAALRMQEELKRYSAQVLAEGGTPIQGRVGINTGEVVVRSIQTGAGQVEYTPIGHTTNLAARMQTAAPVGSIAVSEASRRLCEGYFILKPLGATKVKGVSEPVNVFEVTGLGPLRTRLQRAVGRGLTRFVGREEELAQMRRALELARGGHGQIVAAMGDAGVGKSRLFFEFKAVALTGRLVLEAYSVSHGKASAYLPVTELLKDYFKIAAQDDERTRREKVNGKIITLDRALEDTVPYLFGLLGIAEDPDPIALMDPQIRRRRTIDAIKRTLIRESIGQPLLLIFEDLHWIDDETQALLNVLADAIASARVLLLVNYRPEYTHGWGNKGYYTQLRLDPLGKESAEEMLSWMLGESSELAPLRRLIIDKTEGNPFFMEEIVQALFEEGTLVRNGTLRLARPLGELRVPGTVQAVLASRIDRLPADEKEMLQTLAVIGKEFALRVARETLGRSDAEIEHTLSDLRNAEFIYEQPAVDDDRYTFKHALTQEVAYNSVLIKRRKLLHARIGAAIEKLHPENLDEHLEELARHYGRGNNADKAVDYLTRAGRLASRRGLYREAIAQLRAALERLGEIGDTNLRLQRELPLQITLGTVLALTGGGAQPGAERALLRARELCTAAGETASAGDRISALRGLARFYMDSGAYEAALEIGREMLALAEQWRNPELSAAAHSWMGFVSMTKLDYVGTRSHCERALALMREMGSSTGAVSDPTFSPAGTLSHLAMSLVTLGFPDQAVLRAREAITLARGTPLEDACHSNVASTYLNLRKWELAREHCEAALSSQSENGLVGITELTKAQRGLATAMLGDVNKGIAEIREAISHQSATVSRFPAMAQRYLALACLEAGQAEEGLKALDEFDTIYQSPLASDMTRGELLMVRDPPQEREAERCFRRIIDLAREKHARLFELRAATCLARLLKRRDEIEEARKILAGIYAWFTEGFDTADLKDAKALLDDLRA
jgi:class 3 adenylate cyclase/tetratricopeptide (TPR) repeat protein